MKYIWREIWFISATNFIRKLKCKQIQVNKMMSCYSNKVINAADKCHTSLSSEQLSRSHWVFLDCDDFLCNRLQRIISSRVNNLVLSGHCAKLSCSMSRSIRGEKGVRMFMGRRWLTSTFEGCFRNSFR